MTAITEGMFLLRTFRRLDAAGRLDMVRRIQALALRRLAGHLPAGFDVANVDHCIVAALAVETGAARADVKAAAHLLRACAHAAEAPESFDAESLFDAYIQLDAHSVERDAAAQAKRSEGGKSKRAKLPAAAELRAELAQLQAARGMSEADAKSILRQRHKASAQAVNRKLKKT